MTVELSAREARRIALAAQGFASGRPQRTGPAQLDKLINSLNLLQIDSVNVLTRAHFLPAFSRLGPYDRSLLERAAWGSRRQRRLFEYWAHEASLLPLELQPLLRWRMARARRGEIGYKALRRFAGEGKAEADAVLARIAAEGPLAAADFEDGSGRSGWWEWSHTKHALEYLFWAGRITTATRRPSFARTYDLTERVIPARIIELPTPDPASAQRALIERSARALGVASAADLRDYFRLKPEEGDPAIAALAESGVLVPARVESWRIKAWLHRDARTPRKVRGAALLAPFDPLVWERSRAEAVRLPLSHRDLRAAALAHARLLRAAVPARRGPGCAGRSQGRPSGWHAARPAHHSRARRTVGHRRPAARGARRDGGLARARAR